MALFNEDITIHGDGNQSRDLTYVSDAVSAFLIIARNKKCFHILKHNFSSIILKESIS